MRYSILLLAFCIAFLCVPGCSSEAVPETTAALLTQPTTGPIPETAPQESVIPNESTAAETVNPTPGYRLVTTSARRYDASGKLIRADRSETSIFEQKIPQENPTPEDFDVDLFRAAGVSQDRIHYEVRTEYKKDEEQGFDVFDKSVVEKYDADTLLWSVDFSDFRVDGVHPVSDGILVSGETFISNYISTRDSSDAGLAKIDSNGNILWSQLLINDFQYERIDYVSEKSDGNYHMFSLGDYSILCFSHVSSDGQYSLIGKSELDKHTYAHNFQPFGDGYIAELYCPIENTYNAFISIDRNGLITTAFSIEETNHYYTITDIAEYNGSICLSAYAVPMRGIGKTGQYGEIAEAFELILHKNTDDLPVDDYPGRVLVPLLRESYTAVLIIFDPSDGTPTAFYSVEGSMGGDLSIGDDGQLIWNVESLFSVSYSHYTSGWNFLGVCQIFRYCFAPSLDMVSGEPINEYAEYIR